MQRHTEWNQREMFWMGLWQISIHKNVNITGTRNNLYLFTSRKTTVSFSLRVPLYWRVRIVSNQYVILVCENEMFRTRNIFEYKCDTPILENSHFLQISNNYNCRCVLVVRVFDSPNVRFTTEVIFWPIEPRGL